MWGLNFEAVLAQLAHCFKQGCVFSRSAWILVEISGQEEVGTSRHYTFPREFLVIESTFLPLTTNILEEWGQKHNFSFWAGRMAFICPPKFALRLLTGGEWMEGRPPPPPANNAGSQSLPQGREGKRTHQHTQEWVPRIGSEAGYRRWGLKINFKVQITVETRNSGQKHSCGNLGSWQPEEAYCLVLSNLQPTTLLRRSTSEVMSDYLGHFSEEGLSISMRKTQQTRKVQVVPIQEN